MKGGAVGKDRLVFLDFDGVICDSLNECFVSSWLAYHIDGQNFLEFPHLSDWNGLPDHLVLEDKRRFDSYRPFIRTGGDYVLLQWCVDHGRVLQSQEDFDAVLRELGEKLISEFHSRFYEVRAYLLEHEREFWLSLNILYDGVGEVMKSLENDSRVYILSTKRSSFIAEILASKGIDWPLSRIIDSGREKKVDIILSVLEQRNVSTAAFIDDQVDYFAGAPEDRITCYLASWGYVKPDWLLGSGYMVISREYLKELFAGLT